jgi:hypothetical protein
MREQASFILHQVHAMFDRIFALHVADTPCTSTPKLPAFDQKLDIRSLSTAFKTYDAALTFSRDETGNISVCRGMHGVLEALMEETPFKCVFGPPKSGKTVAILFSALWAIYTRRLPIIVVGSEHSEPAYAVEAFLRSCLDVIHAIVDDALDASVDQIKKVEVVGFDKHRVMTYDPSRPMIFVYRYSKTDLSKILSFFKDDPKWNDPDRPRRCRGAWLIVDEADCTDLDVLLKHELNEKHKSERGKAMVNLCGDNNISTFVNCTASMSVTQHSLRIARDISEKHIPLIDLSQVRRDPEAMFNRNVAYLLDYKPRPAPTDIDASMAYLLSGRESVGPESKRQVRRKFENIEDLEGTVLKGDLDDFIAHAQHAGGRPGVYGVLSLMQVPGQNARHDKIKKFMKMIGEYFDHRGLQDRVILEYSGRGVYEWAVGMEVPELRPVSESKRLSFLHELIRRTPLSTVVFVLSYSMIDRSIRLAVARDVSPDRAQDVPNNERYITWISTYLRSTDDALQVPGRAIGNHASVLIERGFVNVDGRASIRVMSFFKKEEFVAHSTIGFSEVQLAIGSKMMMTKDQFNKVLRQLEFKTHGSKLKRIIKENGELVVNIAPRSHVQRQTTVFRNRVDRAMTVVITTDVVRTSPSIVSASSHIGSFSRFMGRSRAPPSEAPSTILRRDPRTYIPRADTPVDGDDGHDGDDVASCEVTPPLRKRARRAPPPAAPAAPAAQGDQMSYWMPRIIEYVRIGAARSGTPGIVEQRKLTYMLGRWRKAASSDPLPPNITQIKKFIRDHRNHPDMKLEFVNGEFTFKEYVPAPAVAPAAPAADMDGHEVDVDVTFAIDVMLYIIVHIICVSMDTTFKKHAVMQHLRDYPSVLYFFTRSRTGLQKKCTIEERAQNLGYIRTRVDNVKGDWQVTHRGYERATSYDSAFRHRLNGVKVMECMFEDDD